MYIAKEVFKNVWVVVDPTAPLTNNCFFMNKADSKIGKFHSVNDPKFKDALNEFNEEKELQVVVAVSNRTTLEEKYNGPVFTTPVEWIDETVPHTFTKDQVKKIIKGAFKAYEQMNEDGMGKQAKMLAEIMGLEKDLAQEFLQSDRPLNKVIKIFGYAPRDYKVELSGPVDNVMTLIQYEPIS